MGDRRKEQNKMTEPGKSVQLFPIINSSSALNPAFPGSVTRCFFPLPQVPFNRSLALKNAKETMELNKSAHLSCADTFTAWWIGPANLSGSTVEKELEISHPQNCTLVTSANRGAVPILRLDLKLTSTATA